MWVCVIDTSLLQEEREKRLGPGGLDPVEVFASLPVELQECFEKKDIQLLQDTFAKMDPHLAEKYLKDCIDSGMWLPNAAAGGAEGAASDESSAEEEAGQDDKKQPAVAGDGDESVVEPVYEQVDDATQ